jgi:hypothetical protein
MATNDTDRSNTALNSAAGRSSRDLATDQPAGLGPEPIVAGDQDTFSGDDSMDNRDEPVPTTRRKRNPNVPPDQRLGLHPTIPGDVAPETPVNPDLYGG